MCVRWSRSVSGWLISAQNILRRSRFPLVDLYNEVWIGVCSFCFHVGICCATLMMSLMVEFGFQLNKKGDLGSYFLCKMCGIKVWCYQFYSFWYLCDWQMRWKKEERCPTSITFNQNLSLFFWRPCSCLLARASSQWEDSLSPVKLARIIFITQADEFNAF